jgi:hypothetical protein
MHVKKTPPYNSGRYNILSDKVVCISLGAPRCFNKTIADEFCNEVKDGNIVFFRITTNGDPVPGMPFKMSGFIHPCSDDETMRQLVVENCDNLYKIVVEGYKIKKPVLLYEKGLDCTNQKSDTKSLPDVTAHLNYYNILYRNAVDIKRFLASMNALGITKEIQRTPEGATVCRLVFYSSREVKYTFFNLDSTRLQDEKMSFIKKALTKGLFSPKTVLEDVKMSPETFSDLFEKMKVLDLTKRKFVPLKGLLVSPVFDQVEPKVTVKQEAGGLRKNNKTKKQKKTKKQNKTKRKNKTKTKK